MTTFRLNMPSEVTLETVKVFLHDLESQGLLYHIDDDPFDVFNNEGPTFSSAESWALIGFFNQVRRDLDWNEVWEECVPDITD